MILALDIGNSNITAGIFTGPKLVKTFRAPSNLSSYSAFVKKFAKSGIKGIIIASVVPNTTKRVVRDIKKTYPNIKPMVLGLNCIVPIKNRCRHPLKVGQDRLVNAYAAIKLYGFPAIIIDFGTAVTIDVVSKKKEFMGGMILPGLQSALNAMQKQTALLPAVSLSKPSSLIGKDTKNAMLSGIINGYACMTDGLIFRLKNEISKKSRVIGTGGHINFIKPYCKRIALADPQLTLKGLNMIYSNI